MSRLAELIEELCPDGVEYRPLGELLAYQQPTPFLVSSKDYDPSYPTPVLTAGATFLLGYSSETHGVYPASTDDPVIIFDDFTTASKWVDFPFKLKSSAAKILTAVDPNVADIRFLYFLMQTLNYQVGSHARHWIAVYSKMPVCCPPLEVQREIVRILDQFTTLEAELEAELEARRAQYEHYRNHLLSYDSLAARGPVEMVKLGDLGTFVRGGGLQKADFVEQGKPCIHYGQIHTIFGVSADSVVSMVSEEQFLRLKRASLGDLLIATTSEDDEAVAKATAWLGNESVAISGDMFLFRHSLDPRYVSHFFASRHFQKQKRPFVTGAKVRRISEKGLKGIVIPVPVHEEQRRIADLLDRFDALVNDISSGLPAEIAARRAQYEHYRDRLLSFPEKCVSDRGAS
jgi:type I restriction system specificity protein